MSEITPEKVAAESCWVLTNQHGVNLNGAAGVEGVPHFETRDRAIEVGTDHAGYEPRQLAEACTILTCSCCGADCGEEEEGYTLHFFSASEDPEHYGWVRDGDSWFCQPCSVGECDECKPRLAAQAEQSGGAADA